MENKVIKSVETNAFEVALVETPSSQYVVEYRAKSAETFTYSSYSKDLSLALNMFDLVIYELENN